MKGSPVADTTLEVGEAWPPKPAPHQQRRTSIFTITLLLMVLFESINPPESYIHQFLSRAKHLPEQHIPRYAIPFFTYGQLLGFLPLTLLSELAGKCHYVIALGISLRIGSSLLHLLGPASILLPHQIARGLYGLASASKVAIKTHAYANLPNDTYITITGYMRAVNLVAHVMGGTLGFVFYRSSFDWSVAFSVQIACLSVAFVAFFGNIVMSAFNGSDNIEVVKSSRRGPFHEFARTLGQTYRTNRFLAAITIWAIVMDSLQLCFHTQKSSLIHAIDHGAKSNGLAVAGCRLASALVTFLIGRYPCLTRGFRIEWLYGASVIIAMAISASGYAWHVYIVYGSFLIFGSISDAGLCIATAQIALSSPNSIRGWVLFGNQFLAILTASLIQFCFGSILELGIRWVYFGLAIIALTTPIVLVPIAHHTNNVDQEQSSQSSS